jgi:phenylpropionate dioxygenase-like ring-hydroxylating dioxygenase large terminal subunit
MDDGLQTRLSGDASTLPTRVALGRILAPEHFEREREKIFRRAWMPIGHTDDVPKKGSYLVYDMPTFNTSLLIIRGNDDRVRVFHNACRHRGNKIIRDGQGCQAHFVCSFHGWSYTPEGALSVITDEHQFDDVDKAQLGLVPVATEIWENMIFVNFSTHPRETLREWLGELYGQYGNDYFGWHEKVANQQFVLNCNWHLGVNSFTEGYHTLYIHKDTARDYQGGRGNPQRHRPSMELFRRHHRYSAPGNPDHKILPVEAIAIKYGRKLIPAFDFDSTGLPPGVNPTRYDKWAFDVLELFPNFVMLTGNHWRAELWFWPIDAGRTLIVNRAYNYKTKNLGERVSRSYFRSRGRDVLREDLNTLEAQQQMLASGAVPEVVLSRQEMALRHHYKVMADMLGEA